ncbi:hypothetical protein BDR05DRAFT_654981 [Suillus weaverae]|nr:hypothetical protein BDR05DRAFT_654981 [Suillus weaverae]
MYPLEIPWQCAFQQQASLRGCPNDVKDISRITIETWAALNVRILAGQKKRLQFRLATWTKLGRSKLPHDTCHAFPGPPFDPASVVLFPKCGTTILKPRLRSLFHMHLHCRPSGLWIQSWYLGRPVARTVLLSCVSYPPCNVYIHFCNISQANINRLCRCI